MPQRPPSHQKKSTRPPCPRRGGFTPSRAGAARAPAGGEEPPEGARAMHRDTRGAGSTFPASLHPRRRWGSAWGDAAWCWWRRRGKASFFSQLFRRPWWKMENERSVEGRGCQQRRRGSAPRGRKVRGGRPKGTRTVPCPRWGHLGPRQPSAGRWQLAAAAARARRPRTPPAPAPGPRGCREQSFPVTGAGGGARAV